jgi:Holliday junction resolvase RusA-like endonuclease
MVKKGLIKDDRYINKIVLEKVIADEYKIEIVENVV